MRFTPASCPPRNCCYFSCVAFSYGLVPENSLFLEQVMNTIKHFIKIHSIFRYANLFPIVEDVQGAIKLVSRFRIKSEIIGSWLYCFTNPLIGCQLEAVGFWYSFKHCAYVYSGNQKECFADDETLDEIRTRLGSCLVN